MPFTCQPLGDTGPHEEKWGSPPLLVLVNRLLADRTPVLGVWDGRNLGIGCRLAEKMENEPDSSLAGRHPFTDDDDDDSNGENRDGEEGEEGEQGGRDLPPIHVVAGSTLALRREQRVRFRSHDLTHELQLLHRGSSGPPRSDLRTPPRFGSRSAREPIGERPEDGSVVSMRRLFHRLIPNQCVGQISKTDMVFCSKFSRSGNLLVTAQKSGRVDIFRAADLELYAFARTSRSEDDAPNADLAEETESATAAEAEPSLFHFPLAGSSYAVRPLQSFESWYRRWSVLDVDVDRQDSMVAVSAGSYLVHVHRIQSHIEESSGPRGAGMDATAEDFTVDLRIHDGQEDAYGLFSLRFDAQSSKILGGGADSCVRLCDLSRGTVECQWQASYGESGDINTVEYLDESDSNVVLSAGDDAVVRVWDLRCVRGDKGALSVPSVRCAALGSFLGHLSGISHICSRQDGRYFLTNGKDHCVKLWDMRMIGPDSLADRPHRQQLPCVDYDYRFYELGSQSFGRAHKFDQSLMTYSGHRVLRTLIRAYFSPAAQTGQQFIYSGCASGRVRIYDVLSGDEIGPSLISHSDVVRDLSWHPTSPMLVTSSWDRTVCLWNYRALASSGNYM